MSDDFSQVHLTVSADSKTVTLGGQIQRSSTMDLATTVTISAGDNPQSSVTTHIDIPAFPITVPIGAVIQSVAAVPGRTFVISPDAQSITIT